jgi:hypothetical protein
VMNDPKLKQECRQIAMNLAQCLRRKRLFWSKWMERAMESTISHRLLNAHRLMSHSHQRVLHNFLWPLHLLCISWHVWTVGSGCSGLIRTWVILVIGGPEMQKNDCRFHGSFFRDFMLQRLQDNFQLAAYQIWSIGGISRTFFHVEVDDPCSGCNITFIFFCTNCIRRMAVSFQSVHCPTASTAVLLGCWAFQNRDYYHCMLLLEEDYDELYIQQS